MACWWLALLFAVGAPAQARKEATVQSVRVQFREPGGNAIEDVTVRVIGVQQGVIPYRQLPGQEPTALSPTSFRGGFARLTSLPAGELALLVDHPRFARTVSPTFRLPSTSEHELVVVLARGAVVTGRVLGPDRLPVANATVRTESNEVPPGPARALFGAMQAETSSNATATTAADGTFRLERVARGKYRLVVDHFVLAQTEVEVEVRGDVVQQVPPIAMAEGVLVVGRVVREGRPVAGAEVTLWFADVPPTDPVKAMAVKNLKVRCDAQGNFRLPARVPPGKDYVLTAAEGRAQPQQLGAAVTSRRRFEVRRGAREQEELMALPK